MFLYDMDRTGKVPLYEQLTRHIQNDILEGRLPAGTHLPSKRQAAKDLGVSIMTVQGAYGQLLAEGYIRAEERRGYFVAQVERVEPSACPTMPTRREARREREEDAPLDVTKNRVAAGLFPFSTWSKLSRRVLSEQGVGLLEPVPFNGVLSLRQAIAEVLYERCGMVVSPEQIVIGAGNESLYGILLTLLGRQNVYAVETPGYPIIDRLYRQQGVTVRHIDLDDQGIRTDALEASDATVVHISPAHHFPTGTVTSVTRRQELLRWAAGGEGRYIIEDDYDSEFRLSGRPIPPLQRMDRDGRVVYMNTFSKTVAPSLRIAYAVLPSALLTRYRESMGFLSCPVAAFEQHTLAAFIREGYFDRHINRLRTHYRTLRDGLVDALTTGALAGRCHPVRDDAGLHFLVRVDVPPEVDDQTLTRVALACGLRIHTLSDYDHRAKTRPSHTLILNYSGLSSDDISVFAARLESTLAHIETVDF